jgi:hypothetical protein
MPAALISQADPGGEPYHGPVAAAVWSALGHYPTVEGQWRVRVFGDRPPEIRVVVISPQGLRRHWKFEEAGEAMARVIEQDLVEWLRASS